MGALVEKVSITCIFYYSIMCVCVFLCVRIGIPTNKRTHYR